MQLYCTLLVDDCEEADGMISNAKGKQAQVMGYYAPEAVKALKKLSESTRVPQAAYLREALDDLLKKYAGTLRKAAK